MFNTIIVPIDFDQIESGNKTLMLAAKLCGDEGNIIALHALEDIPLDVASQLAVGTIENSNRAAVAALKEVVENSGVEAEFDVRVGSAANAIIDFAEEKKADLVIIASHRPGLKDYFLGSTATRVVRHAQCPVFVNR